jgi:hypothetical protein
MSQTMIRFAHPLAVGGVIRRLLRWRLGRLRLLRGETIEVWVKSPVGRLRRLTLSAGAFGAVRVNAAPGGRL